MSLKRFVCEDCGTIAYRYARGEKQDPCQKCKGKLCGRARFSIRRRGPAEFSLATRAVSHGDAVEVLSGGQWIPARVWLQYWNGSNSSGRASAIVKSDDSKMDLIMNEVRWPRTRKP